ncbi:glutathione S-transferase 1-like [Artemia franciscana]|uniref:glutathione transferase n=1 Tax=Artemia franciscana TaxID=6661 RepID=A0AA88HUE0_ARTSF|nr:hypothetical protein QYM36_010534 [Artemia franciscana]
MTHYKLIYFNAKGRAELIRLIFAYADVNYDDVRIPRDQWTDMKPKMPFGQLPILEIDGKQLPQTMAIARYLAREFKLAGKDELESAFADAYIDVVNDITYALVPMFREENDEKKREIGAAVFNKTIVPYLEKVEKHLKESGTGYIVGDSITWADLAYFQLLDLLWQRFGRAHLDSFPNLMKLHETVINIPNIKKWIDTRPETAV